MSALKMLKDFADEPCQDVAPDSCSGRKRLKEELREAAKEWVQALKDSLAEGLVEEHIMKRDAKIEWIAWFFNLEDYDK